MNNRKGKKDASVRSIPEIRHGVVCKVCACCGEELPLEAFYRYGASHRTDHYCKACRRAASARYRDARCVARLGACLCGARVTISAEPDRARRMELILRARAVVLASMRRKRIREAEAEDARINRELETECASLPGESAPTDMAPDETATGDRLQVFPFVAGTSPIDVPAHEHDVTDSEHLNRKKHGTHK